MSKTQPSSTKIIIYGIEIDDSEIMQARLPINKVKPTRLALEKNVPQRINYIKRFAISDRSA